MKYFKLVLFYLSLVLGLASCEKDISFTPNSTNNLLVVDGSIETGKIPNIVLTQTLNYFSEISPQKLLGSFVRNATVVISDSVMVDTLKEYSIPITPTLNYYVYMPDTLKPNYIKGQRGKTYTLTIVANNSTYKSITTIPAKGMNMDSIWWMEPNLKADRDSGFAVLMGKFTDPPGLGDCFKYYTNTNDSGFLPANNVGNDQIVDGKSITVRLFPGVDRNVETQRTPDNFFRRGDTITVKFSNIDKSSYTFWNTWEFAYRAVGNPFSNPGVVIGNVSNGALGAFCGYNPQYKTLIVPKK